MKRFLTGLAILAVLSMQNVLAANTIKEIQLDMRGYDETTLAAGTFVPVINLQQISTETCPQGYKVKFLSTDDLYVEEMTILPKGTEFYGYIEKINEPIVGTNASMKVKINKIVLASGDEIPIEGYIYTSNNNMWGGELTDPAEYVKMPHYQSKFQGISWNHRSATLQIRPGGKRQMGHHTKINAGERLIIVLTQSANITNPTP
ncbi:hypothetical protein IJ579_05530 [bacterium]|nr:hypothetical protein [bacterium]